MLMSRPFQGIFSIICWWASHCRASPDAAPGAAAVLLAAAQRPAAGVARQRLPGSSTAPGKGRPPRSVSRLLIDFSVLKLVYLYINISVLKLKKQYILYEDIEIDRKVIEMIYIQIYVP